MANNKKKNLNNIQTETNCIADTKEPLKKKRGNPNFIKKQNEVIKEVKTNGCEVNCSEVKEAKKIKEKIIEVIASDQIINDNNEINKNSKVNDNNETNNNILITDDDYDDNINDNNNIDDDLDNVNYPQETNNKKLKNTKKNSSLYGLLSRPSGASMEELERELNWKKPSIRGTISNLQKEQQFCLVTINVIKPNLGNNTESSIKNNKSFYKETRYFIKDCEFNLFDDLLNYLPE